MKARKVIYLQLHEPLHSPAVGNIPATLTLKPQAGSPKTFSKVDMTLEDGVVYIDLVYNGNKASFAVSTYKVAELEPITD